MPANTPRHSLPYPLGTDPIGQTDVVLKGLAERLDAKWDIADFPGATLKRAKNVCGYAERAGGLAGMLVLETNFNMSETRFVRIDIKGFTHSAFNNVIDFTVTFYVNGGDTTYHSLDVNNRGTMQIYVYPAKKISDNKVCLMFTPVTTGSTWEYPKVTVDVMTVGTTTTEQLTGWQLQRFTSVVGNYVLTQMTELGSWKSLSLLNGWAEYAAGFEGPKIKKVGSVVYLKGLIKNGTAGSDIARIPVGWGPVGGKLIFAPWADGSPQVARIDVIPTTDGLGARLQHISGQTNAVSLSGINWMVEDG